MFEGAGSQVVNHWGDVFRKSCGEARACVGLKSRELVNLESSYDNAATAEANEVVRTKPSCQTVSGKSARPR